MHLRVQLSVQSEITRAANNDNFCQEGFCDHIDFDTPWCDPEPIFEALAKRFPNHEMVVISDYLARDVDEYEVHRFKNGSVTSEGRQPYRYVSDASASDENL